MKVKICPICKEYLSCCADEWYCTECDYVEEFKLQIKGDWDE